MPSTCALVLIQLSRSDLHVVRSGEGFVFDVAGVSDGGGLKEYDFGFLVGGGAVFDTARNDKSLAGAEFDRVFPEFDSKAAFPHQEEFVFVVMMMPGELALHFDQLDLLAIQRSDHLWAPVFGKQGEFLRNVQGFHGRMEELGRLVTWQGRGALRPLLLR